MPRPARANLAAALIAIGLWALVGAYLWQHFGGPSDGVRLEPGDLTWKPEGMVVTPLKESPGGLRRGDLVVGLGEIGKARLIG